MRGGGSGESPLGFLILLSVGFRSILAAGASVSRLKKRVIRPSRDVEGEELEHRKNRRTNTRSPPHLNAGGELGDGYSGPKQLLLTPGGAASLKGGGECGVLVGWGRTLFLLNMC